MDREDLNLKCAKLHCLRQQKQEAQSSITRTAYNINALVEQRRALERLGVIPLEQFGKVNRMLSSNVSLLQELKDEIAGYDIEIGIIEIEIKESA